MADDNVTKVVLDLDNEDFVTKMQDALGLLGGLGETDGIEKLATTLGNIAEIAGVIGAAFLAFKTAIDLSEQAEKIEQINKSFEMLATSAGLSASVLKEQLVPAAHGLASETEILQSANKAIISMGANASQLPQIMELARKATSVFGGDLLTNFENLSRGMALGNARMLRQYGIIVDTTTAHQKYAETLGVGVQYLSQAGQHQAIFNAAMEQASVKFKDVDTNITETSNNMKKISTALTEIKEAAALAWEALAGDRVKKITGEIADAVHGLAVNIQAAFGHGEAASAARKESLEREIAQYQQLVKSTNAAFNPGQAAEYAKHLADMEAKLERINAQEEKSMQLQMHKAQAGSGEASTGAGTSQKDVQNSMINNEKLRQDRIKFQGEILKIQQAAEKDTEKVATSEKEFAELRTNEIVTIQQQAAQKIGQLAVARQQGLITSDKQYESAKLALEKKADDDIRQIHVKADNDRVTAMKNLQAQNDKSAAGFAASWKKNTAMAAKSLQSMGQLGDAAFGSMSKNGVAMFESIGNGSETAGEAMKKFMFGSIGDVAIQEGTWRLLSSIWPPNPLGIAVGGGLIALGAALKSMGQSSGSSGPSTSAASVGGGGATGTDTSQMAAAGSAPQPTATQQKSLSVVVQGNIFDTDQTRTRLMDMIRQAGDFTDFNLKQIGQA